MDGAIYELVAMKALCARVPRKGSTGIARAYDYGIEEGVSRYNGQEGTNERRMMTGGRRIASPCRATRGLLTQ